GDVSYARGLHDLKAGLSWRRTPVSSTSHVSGGGIVTYWNTYPNLIAQAQQDYALDTSATYTQAFVTDTVSMDRLTALVGLRFDRQASSLRSSAIPAVSGIAPLPAATSTAADNVYVFSSIAPRVGVAYALDQS